MAKDLAIILNSGSVNSAVVTAMAMQRFRPIFVHLATDPQAGTRWQAAYEQQVSHFKPYREHTLVMPVIAPSAGGAAAAAAAADPRTKGHLAVQLIELLPVLSIAARLASHYQASAIYFGLRAGTQTDDLSAATEFVQVWNELLQLPCGQPELELTAPLLELEPWQVVDLGFQTSAPLEKTWSCDEESSEPCWACRGCRSREAAFQQAGKPDGLHGMRKI
jgi:7-cyano-7-deazaguanine synthase in queuosine biosynthesis